MAFKLTRGGVTKLINDETSDPPHLQILNIRNVGPQSYDPYEYKGPPQKSIEVKLSDGDKVVSALIPVKKCHLGNWEALKQYSIIRIRDFRINKKFDEVLATMLVCEFDIVSTPDRQIGNPDMSNMLEQPPSREQIQQQLLQLRLQQQQLEQLLQQQSPIQNHQQQKQAPQNLSITTQSMHNNAQFANNITRPNPNTKNTSCPVLSPINSNPCHSNEHTLFSIVSLNPYQNKWSLKAKVIKKSEIKTYTNQRGEGKIFSFNIMDDSGEIKVVCFNDACEKFYNLIEEDHVYMISNAKVTTSRFKTSAICSDYEIHLEKTTSVILCQESWIPNIKYNFIKLNRLNEFNKDDMIDIIAIVLKDNGTLQVFSKKNQKYVTKRELVLVDETFTSVRLALWGKLAEEFQVEDNSVIAIKKARVGDFQGRNLSMYANSHFQINPDIDEAKTLFRWFISHGNDENFQPLSNATGISISFENLSRKTISQVINDPALGRNDKADYFSVVGTIAFVYEKSPWYYTACPNCKKKVIDNEDDSWFCSKCEETIEQPDYRYLFTVGVLDYSGLIWVSAFHDTALKLLGIEASELLQMERNEYNKFEATFKSMRFKSFVFSCRAKSEYYQNNEKIKYTLVEVQPLNYVEEGYNLIRQINKFNN
ncbi:3605_t:CDS:1 [Ambispora leptoticha]|uniref:Replication protein A subunit n=1 Tax=Ambispora leptoticha TaxID=144679 RepID=A0A9N8YPR6_9GLOM|nr:3605_t:CDS:1 [Ambispora leptoticha]